MAKITSLLTAYLNEVLTRKYFYELDHAMKTTKKKRNKGVNEREKNHSSLSIKEFFFIYFKMLRLVAAEIHQKSISSNAFALPFLYLSFMGILIKINWDR